jgi:hypothetical protein
MVTASRSIGAVAAEASAEPIGAVAAEGSVEPIGAVAAEGSVEPMRSRGRFRRADTVSQP